MHLTDLPVEISSHCHSLYTLHLHICVLVFASQLSSPHLFLLKHSVLLFSLNAINNPRDTLHVPFELVTRPEITSGAVYSG